MRIRMRFSLAPLLALALSVPCWAGNAERAAEHRKRAAEYTEQGKLSEASLELRNAVQLEPKNVEAHRSLAELYIKQNDLQGAFREYQEVASLDPKDGEARLRVASFYLLGRRFQDAAEHAKKAAELLPNRFEPHAVLARAHGAQKEWDPAVAEMKRAIELAPDNDAMRVELAQIYLAQKMNDQAEQALRHGLKEIPPSKALRVALASVLAATNRVDEADGLMNEVLNLGGSELGTLRTVARYRMKRGDRAGAEELLKKALSQSGEKQPERLQALGDLANFYSLLGDIPQAKATLEEIKKLAPQDGLTLARLANLHLLSEELDQAEPLIQQLVKQSPEDRNTRLLKARLDIARGKIKEGREALETLVEDAPDSANGRLFLGKAYAIEGQWEKARSEYLKVLEEMPDNFFANLDLSRVYLELGRPQESLDAVGKVLKNRPNFPEARRIQGDGLLAVGKAAEAEKAYRELLKDSPKDALLTMRLGQTFEAQGRDKDALDQYEASRKLAPKAVDPILRSITLLERMDRHQQIGPIAEAYLKENGEVPPILNALAVHSMGKGDAKLAKSYIDRSLAADSKAPVTKEIKARILLAEKDLAGARKVLEAAREAAPDRIPTLLLLSGLSEQEGKHEEAKSIYEHVLKVDPDNPVAANNLAMIYARDQLKLPEALRLAQLAVDRTPENPFTRDTLGWIQYKVGSFTAAATHLEQARKLMPENPEIAYHLGVTYVKLGRKQEAKAILQEALNAKEKGDWAFDAGQAMEELKKEK